MTSLRNWFRHRFDSISTYDAFDTDALSVEDNFRGVIVAAWPNSARATALRSHESTNSGLSISAQRNKVVLLQ